MKSGIVAACGLGLEAAEPIKVPIMLRVLLKFSPVDLRIHISYLLIQLSTGTLVTATLSRARSNFPPVGLPKPK